MKEIIAIIRPEKMNKTKKALTDAGVSSMTAFEAVGRGKGLIDFKNLEGAQEGYEEAIENLGMKIKFYPKRFISIVLNDNMVEDAIKTIIEINQTKKPGDGKIFVTPIFDSVRVRDGVCGEETLDIN
jgi:nitrogen regulatory protein PII 2